MEIKSRILKAMERCSIIVGAEDAPINLDSFSYINAIIEIEGEFDIEIPDYYMGENLFISIESVTAVVVDLLNNNR